MDATVNELIERLESLGDEKWRDAAIVRILTKDGGELSTVDAFDVKRSVTTADIFVKTNLAAVVDDWYDDDDDDDDGDGDWDDDDDE